MGMLYPPTRIPRTILVAQMDARALLVVLCCWFVWTSEGFLVCNGSTSCNTNCSVQVTVDLDSSVNCASLLVANGISGKVNTTCNNLQDVLNWLSVVSGYNHEDCIAVNLLPGTHTVTHNVTIEDHINVVLIGVESLPPSTPSSSSDPPSQVIYPI